MIANQSTPLHPDAPTITSKDRKKVLDVLTAAADTFVKHVNDTTEIWAASRDWFLEEWGRDTFIALPGLLLSTERYDDARAVFRHFAAYERGGLIPNRVQDGNVLYNTVDGSLWFIHALSAFEDATHDDAFISEMLPTVENILEGYQSGTTYQRFGQAQRIAVDATDGLVMSPPQATWMDADPSGNGTSIVTPRHGKCVEINALWYSALLIAAQWLDMHDEPGRAEALRSRAVLVKRSFNDKFWNKNEECLYDVIDGDPHSGAIRCNQIFAISHGRDLISHARQRAVLDTVTTDLLTPAGLRTLSGRDSHYFGVYDTSAPMEVKDLAYHQGTVWPWLLGPYCDAVVIVETELGTDPEAIKNQLQGLVSPLVHFCLQSEYHNLPEVFSGNPPHDPGGTTAQAWSVGEILRVITQYRLLER